MTQTEHLADLFARLGRGRIDVAQELAELLMPEPNVVDIEVPDALMAPTQVKRKKKAE